MNTYDEKKLRSITARDVARILSVMEKLKDIPIELIEDASIKVMSDSEATIGEIWYDAESEQWLLDREWE